MTMQQYDAIKTKEEISSLVEVTDIQLPVVEDMESYAKAGDMAKFLKNKIKAIDEKRKEYTLPFARQVKVINADFKKIIDPIKKVVNEINDLQKVFYIEEQKRKDAEQEALEAEAIEAGDSEVAIVNDIKSTTGDVSSTTASQIKSFEVMDETLVPAEFMMVDEKKIKEHMKSNFNNPPEGIRYYYDVRISNR